MTRRVFNLMAFDVDKQSGLYRFYGVCYRDKYQHNKTMSDAIARVLKLTVSPNLFRKGTRVPNGFLLMQ